MGAPHSKKKNEKILSTKQSNIILQVKIVMLGSTIAGKTTLINSLINNEFDESILGSSLVQYSSKDIKINDKEIIKLHIWDTLGRERLREINKHFIKKSDMYIIVFDVRNKKEMNEISFFLDQIKELEKNYKTKPIFLIGNKCEKNNEHPREISKEIAEDFASKIIYFILK